MPLRGPQEPRHQTMYRCSIHAINYPQPMTRCLVDGCTEVPSPLRGAPDEDWRDKVRRANEPQTDNLVALKTEGWRTIALMDAGFSLETASKLATSDGDLHKMCDAGIAGCTDELALAIFL